MKKIFFFIFPIFLFFSHFSCDGKDEKIKTHSFGFRAGFLEKNKLSAEPSLTSNDFFSIYSPRSKIHLSFFYEWIFFQDFLYGQWGIRTVIDILFFQGKGHFVRPLLQTNNTNEMILSDVSSVRFFFYTLPIIPGLYYQTNFFPWVHFFLWTGLGPIGYIESRDDSFPDNRRWGLGFFHSVGILFSLNQLFSEMHFELNQDYGIENIYLSIEFQEGKTIPLKNNIYFSSQAVMMNLKCSY